MSDPDRKPENAMPTAPPVSNRLPGLHRIAPVVLLVLGAATMAGSFALGLGELTRPGPGLAPLLVSALLTGTAAGLIFVDVPSDYERWTRGTVRIGAGLLSLAAFIVLFQTAGFLVPAFGMLLLWLRVFGGESWRWSLGLAAAGAVGLHLLFVEALGVPFPDGLLSRLPVG
jgi:putative tricarboxylic transport membrane protein